MRAGWQADAGSTSPMFSVYVLAGSSVVSLDFLPPGWKATENSTELPSEVLKENWRMEGDLMSIGTSKSSPGARLCTRDSMWMSAWRALVAACARRGGSGPPFRVWKKLEFPQITILPTVDPKHSK